MRNLILAATLAVVGTAQQQMFYQHAPTEVGSFLEIQAPAPETEAPLTINLAADAGLSCMLWDKMMQFNLGDLRSDTGYKSESAKILFNFCQQFTIT
jgi:hypothetical protein